MSFSPDESQGKNGFLKDQVLAPVPKRVLRALAELSTLTRPLYFSGGVVRDWLLGRVPVDLDITVADGALALATQLASRLGGAFIPLSREEGVARVVWGEWCIDICQFREGTTTIVDDLRRRDFTVNAMAVGFDPACLTLANGGQVLDPLGGLRDLSCGLIRLCHAGALAADPLRLLRAYRFRAVFGWVLEPETRTAIASQGLLIRGVSGERIAAELDTILACDEAYPSIREMADAGLLFHLFPELGAGVGLLQPPSHHLDVFGHSLETLRQMERILQAPAAFFAPHGGTGQGWSQDLTSYLSSPRQGVRLKYAALFHDLGKTVTCADKEGRITFHNHDEAGVALMVGIAQRLRFSNDDTRRISQLVRQHMWPFHLHNARVRTGITPKAILRLVKAAGDELFGLFFLVMADSLAGQGPGKPEGMECAVAALFNEVYETYVGRLKPIMEQPLLTGLDLIETLHLTPGPLFRRLLDGLMEARATQPGMTKEGALAWAKEFADRAQGG
jgi:poly(A) polymerase